MSVQALADIQNQDSAIVHGTCVSVAGQGALIVGRSGSGKSGLALQMMALGAGLVADDKVRLRMAGGNVLADAHPNIEGLIEARGIGLLKAEPAGPTPIALVVDMDRSEPARLPKHESIVTLRQTVLLLRAAAVPNLAEALMQLLRMGRLDPECPNT